MPPVCSIRTTATLELPIGEEDTDGAADGNGEADGSSDGPVEGPLLGPGVPAGGADGLAAGLPHAARSTVRKTNGYVALFIARVDAITRGLFPDQARPAAASSDRRRPDSRIRCS